MPEISTITDAAVHQLVLIDGRTWKDAASVFGMTVEEARAAFERAHSMLEARHGAASDVWRNSVTQICLDVASQAQRAFDESRGKHTKRTKKSGPRGDYFETTVEEKAGDPRFLNTRLAAASAIAGIQVPKEINLNTRSEHDIRVSITSLADDDLDRIAEIAQMEMDGLIEMDKSEPLRIGESPIDAEFSVVREPEAPASEAATDPGTPF